VPKNTASTLPAALEAWGAIDMTSPVKKIEKQDAYNHGQQSQGHKNKRF
jgi:hypothetical protein